VGVRKGGFNCICESANLAFATHLLKGKHEDANTQRQSKRCKKYPKKISRQKAYRSIRLRTAQNDSLNRDLRVSFLHDGISS